jgi:hypothetical protein
VYQYIYLEFVNVSDLPDEIQFKIAKTVRALAQAVHKKTLSVTSEEIYQTMNESDDNSNHII